MVCYKMCALASDQGWLRHCGLARGMLSCESSMTEFFEGFVGKCKHFFDTYILPELMTRRRQFSSCSQESAEEEKIVYCYCGMPEEPDNPMIACDAPDCPIEWFHFSCVGISEEPESDEEWYCDECIED